MCVPVAATLLVVSFTVGGPPMWLAASFGGIIGAIAFPALAVYRNELFPTGSRSLASVLITAAALLGGIVGLVTMGALLDRGRSHGAILGSLALAQILVVAIVLLWYPETAHRELEDLNPIDQPLHRLDHAVAQVRDAVSSGTKQIKTKSPGPGGTSVDPALLTRTECAHAAELADERRFTGEPMLTPDDHVVHRLALGELGHRRLMEQRRVVIDEVPDAGAVEVLGDTDHHVRADVDRPFGSGAGATPVGSTTTKVSMTGSGSCGLSSTK